MSNQSKRLFLISFILCFTMLIGCQPNSSTNKDKQEKVEQADKNQSDNENANVTEEKEISDQIILSIENINVDRLRTFYENTLSQKKDKITVTSDTVEGEPITTVLDYDGEKIHINIDNLPDGQETTTNFTTTCKGIRVSEDDQKYYFDYAECESPKVSYIGEVLKAEFSTSIQTNIQYISASFQPDIDENATEEELAKVAPPMEIRYGSLIKKVPVFVSFWNAVNTNNGLVADTSPLVFTAGAKLNLTIYEYFAITKTEIINKDSGQIQEHTALQPVIELPAVAGKYNYEFKFYSDANFVQYDFEIEIK